MHAEMATAPILLDHSLVNAKLDTSLQMTVQRVSILTNVLLKVTCVHIDAQTFLGPTDVFAQEASRLQRMDECVKMLMNAKHPKTRVHRSARTFLVDLSVFVIKVTGVLETSAST